MHRLSLLLLLALPLQAQWQLQQSNTSADLRGIHSLGQGIAWASGTAGTILRTTDGGQHWQPCATPPAAEHLDFRGIQAFDAQTAIVMSSGKGDLSRLFKTTDACQTWKLIFTNPDKEGFWDALQFDEARYGLVLGDPVDGYFVSFISLNGGKNWIRQKSPGMKANSLQESIFAASNSSLIAYTMLVHRFFVTGGIGGPRFVECNGELRSGGRPERVICGISEILLPLAAGSESSGAFSLAQSPSIFVAVGGDYKKPNDASGTAAFSSNDSDERWTQATTPPHGYRSSVAYSPTQKAWITVGPNGTDLSTDDGRNWHPLRPSAGEAPDADRNWNALSLPFVVGPHGRIGLLTPSALPRP